MPSNNASIFTLRAFIITSSLVYFTNGIEKTVYIHLEEDSTMTSEFVSLAVVRELLETQEKAFKQFIEFHTNSVKEEINTLRKYVDDLKTSLVFSQKDIDDVKEKCHKAEERLMETEDGLTEANSCIDELYDQQEQLENHSRRNNVKIMGIPENGNETWEESEQKAIEVIRTRLQIAEELKVERAHRVGKPRPPYRHIGGEKLKSKPRPIIVKFQEWKTKEKVVRTARKMKPDGLMFYEDFAQRTLQRRRELIPELIRRRKQGKQAFIVMDRIVEYDTDRNETQA